MKVLFIAPFNLRFRDGTTTRVLNLAKAALQISKEVYLVSPVISGDLQSSNLIYVRIRDLRPMHHFALAYTSELLGSLVSRFGIKLLGISHSDISSIKNVDIIHVHWILFKYFAKIMQRVISRSIPIVIDLHGSWRLQYPSTNSVRDIIAFLLGGRYESYVLTNNKDVNAFTSPSRSLNNYLILLFNIDPRKMFEVRDAVDPEVIELSKRCEKTEDISRYLREIPDSKYIIAYIGTLSTYHGFPDLLKAYVLVKRFLSDNIRMMLITSNKLSARLGSDLIVLNNVPRKFIPCILRRASVLVLPHKAGTQFDFIPSNKIYDYMLAGRPIVAYRTPAVDNTLRGYKMYVPVKPNDPIELARGIVRAIELYNETEPEPAFDRIPTLNEVAESLKRTYLSLIK